MTACVVALLGTLFPNTAHAEITVTSPTGGDVWTADSEVTVSWGFTHPTLPGDGIVILIRDGVNGPGASIRFSESAFRPTITAGDGQATLAVPTWLGDGADYYVEIRSELLTQQKESGLSDAPVFITGSGPIKRLDIRAPTSGVRWRAGERAYVAWDFVGMWGVAVELDLQPGNVHYRPVPGSDGWAIIDVPTNIGNGVDYQIALIEHAPLPNAPSHARAFDESPLIEIYDALPRPTFFITTPDGSESFTGGAEEWICWGGTATDGRLLATFLDGTEPQGRLFTSANLTDGCVPRIVCPYTEGDDYRAIGITEPADSMDVLLGGYVQLVDASDGRFSVESTMPMPTLSLTSQNDGATLMPNQQYTITWTSSGFSKNEFLAAYLVANTDALQIVEYIGGGRVSDGAFTTSRFCPSVEPGATYRVRICVSPNYCPEVCDESETPFDITPIDHNASLAIVSPVGGEVFRDGQFVRLEYTASDVAGMTLDVRQQIGAGFLNPFASEPAMDGGGTIEERLRLPYGEVPSRAYRLVAQLKDGACTLLQEETGFFTVKNLECTCADVNGDLLVNLHDAADFVSCLGASESSGSGLSGSCRCSDLDGSGLVDIRDYGAFQNLFGIGDEAEPPDCPHVP
jgi:hypothetical protein